MQEKYLGIDIGGTKVMLALVSSDGLTLKRDRIETRAEEGPRKVVERIVESIKKTVGEVEIAGVGLGVPGPIDFSRGVVTLAPNLGWKNVAIVDLFSEKLDLPIYLENDALVAAWGEKTLGAGKGFENFIYMTISTGIGGGLILDGKLYRGAFGAGGEIGHMIIDPAGPTCGCGNQGCLEALASGKALARMGREALEQGRWPEGPSPEGITGSTITNWAKAGDQPSIEIIDRQARFLGLGLTNLTHILDPQAFVLGGGVMTAADLLLPRIKEAMEDYLMPGYAERLQVLPAKLGDIGGALGAAMVARDFGSKK